MTDRLTTKDLDELCRVYPEVFDQWVHQGQRTMGDPSPRDPYGPSRSDRDRDRSRRNTPGIIIYDEPPIEDSSSGPQSILTGDNQQEVCRVKHTSCKDLAAVVRVFPPQEGSFPLPQGGNVGPGGNLSITDASNPFNQPPNTIAGLPATLSQMVEVIGYLSVGHQNAQLIIPFNMPLGQFVRLQHVGSFLQVSARLTPRYTAKLGAGSIFSWLVAPAGSNFDRNVAFDNPPALSSGIAGVIRPLMLQGFCGKSFIAPVPATRIFFGWVDALAVQNTQHLCPVARGAQTVLLKADGSAANNDPAAGAAFQGAGLTFNEICQSPGGGTSRRLLNQPANTTVRLSSDCVCIEVVNTTVPPVGATPRFELIYDVGL